MTLARRFLLVLWSAVTPSTRASSFWSRLQYVTHDHPLVVSRDFPPYQQRRPVAGLTTPRGIVWRLALVGCFLGILAPSLQDAASPVAGKAMGPLRLMALGSRASFVLSRAGDRSLTLTAHLGSRPDDRFTLDDKDLDDDDSTAMPPLILGAYFLPPAPIGIGFNDSTRACVWPARYLTRPQLLTRL
jgi:hypothetical protein